MYTQMYEAAPVQAQLVQPRSTQFSGFQAQEGWYQGKTPGYQSGNVPGLTYPSPSGQPNPYQVRVPQDPAPPYGVPDAQRYPPSEPIRLGYGTQSYSGQGYGAQGYDFSDPNLQRPPLSAQHGMPPPPPGQQHWPTEHAPAQYPLHRPQLPRIPEGVAQSPDTSPTRQTPQHTLTSEEDRPTAYRRVGETVPGQPGLTSGTAVALRRTPEGDIRVIQESPVTGQTLRQKKSFTSIPYPILKGSKSRQSLRRADADENVPPVLGQTVPGPAIPTSANPASADPPRVPAEALPVPIPAAFGSPAFEIEAGLPVWLLVSGSRQQGISYPLSSLQPHNDPLYQEIKRELAEWIRKLGKKWDAYKTDTAIDTCMSCQSRNVGKGLQDCSFMGEGNKQTKRDEACRKCRNATRFCAAYERGTTMRPARLLVLPLSDPDRKNASWINRSCWIAGKP